MPPKHFETSQGPLDAFDDRGMIVVGADARLIDRLKADEQRRLEVAKDLSGIVLPEAIAS